MVEDWEEISVFFMGSVERHGNVVSHLKLRGFLVVGLYIFAHMDKTLWHFEP